MTIIPQSPLLWYFCDECLSGSKEQPLLSFFSAQPHITSPRQVSSLIFASLHLPIIVMVLVHGCPLYRHSCIFSHGLFSLVWLLQHPEDGLNWNLHLPSQHHHGGRHPHAHLCSSLVSGLQSIRGCCLYLFPVRNTTAGPLLWLVTSCFPFPVACQNKSFPLL